MVAEAGYDSFESLQLKFPGKVSDDDVERFLGAETRGRNKNNLGEMLISFVRNLDSLNGNSDGECKVEVLDSILEFDVKKLEQFETVVIHSRESCEVYMDYVVDAIGLSAKKVGVIMIFDDEKDHRYALNKLSYWENERNMKVLQVFFTRNPGVTSSDGSLYANLVFAIIFGKFHVSRPPLKYLNQTLESSLRDVVSAVSSPGAEVAYVSVGPQVPISLVNKTSTADDGLSVTYFATKKVLDRFVKKKSSCVEPECGLVGSSESMEASDKSKGMEPSTPVKSVMDSDITTVKAVSMVKSSIEKQSSTSKY